MIEIPGYKIHREIDSSDYCRSYSAIQLSTGKTMVVSIFSHSATQYTSFQTFFNNIEKKLAHNSFGVIAPIKEFIKTKRHTYIISDLLSNSCRNVYQEKVADIELLLNEIYKIALSLDLYHQVGFYHGGISLDNLFHNSDNSLMLGLAAFNQNFVQQDKALNIEQESYKAPEKEVALSKSRDFYALGVVLFELIFKQKPFESKSVDHLEKLKNAAVIHIPDSKLNHFKPIFTALLNPNPDNRVNSAEDFRQLVSATGIQLNDIIYTIKSISTNHNIEANNSPKDVSKKKIPAYLYYGTAILVIAVIAIIAVPSFDKDILNNNDINLTNNTTDAPSISEEKRFTASKTIIEYEETDFKSLIASANNYFNSKQYAGALMAINQALKIHPNDKNALFIQQNAKTELKVNAIIKQAEQHIEQGFLVTPISNSALSNYKKLITILPKDDERILDGFNKISNRYYGFALNQFNTNDSEAALVMIQKGLAISPEHNKLKQLKILISQKQALQKQLQQTKIIEQEKERIALLELKEQQQLQALKAVQQQKKKEKEREDNIRSLIAQQQKLNKLYAEADGYLEDTQLTINSINKAIISLNSLERLAFNSARNLQLKHKIDNAYASLTEYQISINDFPLAQNTINQGLLFNTQNIRLKTLKGKINALLAQQKPSTNELKQKESSLPIFGTF